MLAGGSPSLLLSLSACSLSLAALVLAMVALRRALRRQPTAHSASTPLLPADIEAQLQAVHAAQASLAERLGRNLPAPGLVRFSAYGPGGPPLSFALALVDAHGDGAVLTSLFGREESRLYAKPITAGDSAIPLSAEEREAVHRTWTP